MKTFTIERELRVPRPLAEVFPFFSDPGNLEELTPPFLGFRIVSRPDAIRTGSLIHYKLRLRGIPLHWTSEISEWNPPCSFVDVQRRGPYRMWEHRHTFEEVDDGAATLVGDRVEYAVPGGALVNRLFVRPDLEKVFDYRCERMEAIFGKSAD